MADSLAKLQCHVDFIHISLIAFFEVKFVGVAVKIQLNVFLKLIEWNKQAGHEDGEGKQISYFYTYDVKKNILGLSQGFDRPFPRTAGLHIPLNEVWFARSVRSGCDFILEVVWGFIKG